MRKFFKDKIFSRSGFFWTVNVIFMAVSVLHAGVFFGITGNGHDIPGIAQYLGFAVSFFLDLVTIILMQALLEAKYRSDEQKAKQLLLFIAATCATSTFANLAISLNDFNAAKELPNAPLWIQIAAPYVLASFPLFVILMSIAAEMIVNVRPLDSLNAEEYEKDEQKRIKLLQIRNDYLQKQADEEMRALQIRSQMQMNKRFRSGKLPKSFRWFWEKPIDIDAIITGVSVQFKAIYEPQIEQLKQQVAEVKNEVIVVQKVEEKVSQIEPEKIPSRTTDPLKNPLPKITKKLDTKELKSFEEKPQNPGRKTSPRMPKLEKNLYLKSEVAKLAKCDIFEVEKALENGTLQTSKSGDKVLKSSLEKFIVARKKAVV